MEFNDFIKEGKVIKGTKDTQKAKALVKMSHEALRAATKLAESNDSASFVLSTAYTALRHILEAICLQQGYKVYSHEAYTYFLHMIEENIAAEKFDRYRRLRNGIEYYGKTVSVATSNDALKDIKNLTAHLRKKYLTLL